MTAAEVKEALRRHHPGGTFPMPGPWTCIEEWRSIDLLAISAWSSQGGYARVGYEVKVSRSDLRRELLRPQKRSLNVAWCNEFYFAVPPGLLTAEEIAYQEPGWAPEDFQRTPCRYSDGAPNDPGYRADPGPCRRGKRHGLLVGPMTKPVGWDEGWASTVRHRPRVEYPCDGCAGRAHEGVSRVEREAPTVWVPQDVGLVEIASGGVRVVRRSPRRKEVPPLNARELGQLIRWVSIRPDPRHQDAIRAALTA